METARYGSIQQPRNQTMNVEIQNEEAQPLVGNDEPHGETSGSPGIPCSIHISMFLIGLWRSRNRREQPNASLIHEDLNEDDDGGNPTPDTIRGDTSTSEGIDLIAEAEFSNIKKRDFPMKSE